jgi:hypothetical protein
LRLHDTTGLRKPVFHDADLARAGARRHARALWTTPVHSEHCHARPNKLRVQFPTLHHGDVTVADSTCIFKYLQATYPEQMAIFGGTDAKTCANITELLATHPRYAARGCVKWQLLWIRIDQSTVMAVCTTCCLFCA